MRNQQPRHVARVYCKGRKAISEDYNCTFGCIACGACVNVCKFHAISIADTGAAVVDDQKCVNCGQCMKVCPQGIIRSTVKDNAFLPLCSNADPGAEARKECENSCIACRLCEKNCPMGAITIEDNHPVIDGEKCSNCGFCEVKCPRNVIVDARGIIVKKGGAR